TSVAFEEWLTAERQQLRVCAHEVFSRLLGFQMDRTTPTALATALALIRLDPLHEPAHRALMRLLAMRGRRAEALRQYQVCVDALERELAVSPEPATTELYERLLRAGNVTAGVRSSRGSERPPVGRAAGRLADAGPMMGRDAELQTLQAAAAEIVVNRHGKGFLITGEAGIGKTRLVEELLVTLQPPASRRRVRLLIGRCYVAEQVLSLRPWAQALRSAGDIVVRRQLKSLHPAYRAE